VTDMKSKLAESADEVRRQIYEQRTDAEAAKGALLELLLDRYDTVLESFWDQIDANSSEITAIKEQLEALKETAASHQGHRPPREARELEKWEKEGITALILANTTSPVRHVVVGRRDDEFDRLDRLDAEGKLDEYGKP
jgi:hypothetical protein